MSTTVAIPLLSTVCSPGTEKASILNRISLIWQPISATRTSTRPWCISRLPRNYCNKPVSGFAYRAPRSCGAQQEKTHEAHAISSTPTRLFPRLAGSAAECLPPYRAVLSGQLAVVLRFVASAKKNSVAKLALSDFTAADVLAFLESIEQVRRSSIGTRNCRLSALHSFFSFVTDREPLVAAQCAAVLRIPTKQAPKPEICALEEDEITAILAQPDRSKIEGQRDHVLLAFLFNTGARIQEALDLTPRALRLESPFQARLF